MTNVNKTLYIPLYGKALVSKKGIILSDTNAEEIWAAEGFDLKGKSKSKYLAYYMGMRAAVFDKWTADSLSDDCVVIHLGCGLDSRAERVAHAGIKWFDVDFADVIDERRRFFADSDEYCMIGGDIRDSAWLDSIPVGKCAVVVMEGVSMYLREDELKKVMNMICAHFDQVRFLMDCYSVFAAKMSKYKNPVKDVGVTEVYGIDDAENAVAGTPLRFVKEHEMTPADLIEDLSGSEKRLFSRLYAGGFSKKLYRMYEYIK